jgi:hypothetical protein
VADFGIIIPVRNDLPNTNLQVEDLWPNTSQKNSVYDGEGQSGYLHAQMDQPAATVFTGEAYTSGSRMTTGAVAAAALAAAADWSSDAGHAGNDVRATASPSLGLAAYLRERVQRDPAGGADTLVAAEVDLIVTAIIARVQAGQSVTAANINTIVTANAVGASVLCGADGNPILGGSFGSVQDVLRILSGEVYYVPTNTIIADEAGLFLPLTHPDGVGEVLTPTVNTRRGIVLTANATQLAATPLPVSTGRYLVDGETGYIPKRQRGLTTAFRASASSGKLRTLHDNVPAMTIDNTGFYAYTALTVDAAHPRAVQLDNTNIALGATTIPAVRCYDNNGNLLNVP